MCTNRIQGGIVMKKHISILLVLVLLMVAISGCGKASDNYAKGEADIAPEISDGAPPEGDLLENNIIAENRKIIENYGGSKDNFTAKGVG